MSCCQPIAITEWSSASLASPTLVSPKPREETFQKWGGHDIALGDMVRVIRTFRPDVICTRFQGAARDGHGNHQASGILTREAFHAAADPTRFPDQIREGLQPWQAKKLYMDNVRANEDWTIKLETSQNDPLLGETYVQFAWKGLAASAFTGRRRAGTSTSMARASATTS